jgi:spore maturation protein CgeB
MRVAVVDAYYPSFVASHYAQRPGLEDASYAEQLGALMARRMGTSDAYSVALRALGHEAVEIVANAWQLHEAWGRENGLRVPPLRRVPGRAGAAARRAAGRRVVAAQLNQFAPEIVYVQEMFSFSRRHLDDQRAAGRFLAGQIASAPPANEILRGYDIVFTSFPHFVDRFRALGVDSVYLPLAFDPRVLDELGPLPQRTHDVVFVGGVDPRLHPAGTRLLERIAQQLPLEVWGYAAASLPADSILRERHRGEAWGLDMFRVLASARVCVNRHIDVAEGFANNMRLFEATGAGALLCTEAAPNLHELFAPGRELVTYASVDDLTDRIRDLLADEPGRAAIASAGQARTLADHDYVRRVEQIAAVLEEHRGAGRAAAR